MDQHAVPAKHSYSDAERSPRPLGAYGLRGSAMGRR
jgi:hypothetical protein